MSNSTLNPSLSHFIAHRAVRATSYPKITRPISNFLAPERYRCVGGYERSTGHRRNQLLGNIEQWQGRGETTTRLKLNDGSERRMMATSLCRAERVQNHSQGTTARTTSSRTLIDVNCPTHRMRINCPSTTEKISRTLAGTHSRGDFKRSSSRLHTASSAIRATDFEHENLGSSMSRGERAAESDGSNARGMYQPMGPARPSPRQGAVLTSLRYRGNHGRGGGVAAQASF